jgi:uncharacterized membrane protein (Fun14 family)
MGESFFSRRNQVDPEIVDAPITIVEQMLDATARRLALIKGTLAAAEHLQRLADICAGAYVLPIDHWRQLGLREQQEPTLADLMRPAAAPAASRRQEIIAAIAASPITYYGLGAFIGFVIGWTLS